jgi:CheY-like chemotaxis protein
MMPVMSGQQFRRAQLADPTVAHLPVLVVSAHPDAEHIAREMGAIGAFTKPFDLEALSLCVTSRCGSR